MAGLEVVAVLRFQNDPRARLEGDGGVKVVQPVLRRGGIAGDAARVEPPVEHEAAGQQVIELAVALGLEQIAQAETDDVLRGDGINVVVVGQRERLEHEARLVGVELRQLTGIRAGVRHINVIGGRLDDMAQAVHIERRIGCRSPEARGLEGDVDTGVEFAPVTIVFRRTVGGVHLAVISHTSADVRRDVEPVEECPRQRNLMVGVRPRGGVGVKAVELGIDAIGVERRHLGGGQKLAIIAEGALAVVIHRRVEHLLAIAGEAHVGQPLDLVEEAVDARRGQGVEAPVVPILVRLNKGIRLRIVGVIGFKKVEQQERIGLVVDERLDVEIRRGRVEPDKLEALAILIDVAELREDIRAQANL